MAQSAEYPDLKWVPPAAWTNANRTSVQLIVIHTTEGAERSTSAEDGAAYDARRTDGTSTHYFHDSDSTVQCVRTEDQAHAARSQGNRRGIQHELCGRAGQGNVGWSDAASQGTLRRAAKQAARDAKKWGIPVRHLTVSQVATGEKGFCGHVDITYAFPSDRGTHTDPGPTFPWTQFLDLVRAELEEPMTPAEMDTLVKKIWSFDPGDNATGAVNGGVPLPGWTKAGDNASVNPAWALGRTIVGTDVAYQIRKQVDAGNAALAKILANVTADDGEAQQIIGQLRAVQAEEAGRDAAALATILQAIAAGQATVDVDALAAAIVALTPPGTLTEDGVEQALRNVLREGTDES